MGNTSASWTDNLWHSLYVLNDFCVGTNGESYAALGYNEGMPGLVYNPAGTVQAPRPIRSRVQDGIEMVRVDDAYLYVVTNNSDWDHLQSCFVMRFRRSDRQPAPWSNGQNVTYSAGTEYGVVGLMQSKTAQEQQSQGQRAEWLRNRITGLAVNDSYLAVAHKAQNVVYFYDKKTGAAAGTIPVAEPGQLAFAADGALWIISQGQVKRYVSSAGAAYTAQATLPGIVQALALDAHPRQDLVLVADGGSSQQLKTYNAAGALQWTYGRAGGYPVLGPDVAYDKFWFQMQDPMSVDRSDRDLYGSPFTFVKWAPDGTYWVMDTANLRALHFSATNTYIEQIAYLPDRLMLAGDQKDPTRMFSGKLEFKVSLAPLQPGDQSRSATPSWQLVKNWGGGIDNLRYGDLVNVTTHANGRTYGQMHDNSTNAYQYNQSRSELVELPARGAARLTGIVLEDYGNGTASVDQMPDGDLVTAREDEAKYNYDGTVELRCERRAVVGYESSGNPKYGPLQVEWAIRSTFRKSLDPYFDRPANARIRLPRTANGNYVTYQPKRKGVEGAYHLGTVAVGGKDWKAKFHREKNITQPDGQGSYPGLEAFGGLDGANVYADGNSIVALYNGQNNATSNTFYHFSQDGLLLSEFGVSSSSVTTTDTYSPPGLAGNNIDMYMVRVNPDVLHVYSPDESAHAGLHRWRVEGTSGIVELTGSGEPGSVIQVGSAAASPTRFYYQTGAVPAGGTAALASWNSEPDGSGQAPTSFTAPEQTFYITRPAPGGAPVAVGGNLIQGRNSRLVVGDGSGAAVRVVLTTTNADRAASTIDVGSNGELEIQGATGVLPVLGNVAATGTVLYNARRSDIVLASATGMLGALQLKNNSVASLAQNVLLQGNLTLTTGGMLQLGVYDATLAPGKTATGDADSYVRTAAGGALRQTVAAASSGAPVFYPVGQSSYNPAWLSQSSAGTTDIFAVSVGDSTFAQFSPVAVNTTNPNRGRGRDMRGVGQPIVHSTAGAARTWYIDEMMPGGSNLVLKLQNVLTTGPTPPKVDVSHYHIPADAPEGALPTWDANPADQIGVHPVTEAGEVKAYAAARANITDFSPFTLSAPTVLPVELTAFGARRTAAAVSCSWETASEKNSDYFLVERSTDGFGYVALGKVLSAGSTTERQHYRFTDEQPLPRQLYYRLRQVDKDGTQSFSPVVIVAGAADGSTALHASVVPNPGTGLFELRAAGSTVLEANIYNAMGRHVWRLLPEPEQARRLRFDLTSYPAGVYIVRVRTAEGTTTLKVVKTN